MAGRIPDTVIDEITRKADILEVIGSYVTLERKGSRWLGCCPFHSEKTPSFSVSPEKNLWYCFGCHKGGGLFQFLMEIDNLTFPEAAQGLADKLGIAIPDDYRDDGIKDTRKALGDLYRRVSQTFHWLLLNHQSAKHARKYVEKRGIDEATRDAYRLGWAPSDGEWLYRFLLEKSFSEEFLASSGLFSRKSHRWCIFTDRLMFPVMPNDDTVVAFSGRALGNREPKYINSPETALFKKSHQLYGLAQARQAIRKTKSAILCEGNVDVLAFHQSGIEHVVAPLGTAFTEDQALLIKRRSEKLILAFDGDKAGREATKKGAILAEKTSLKVEAAPMPEGLDPADLVQRDGWDSLKKIVDRPITIFEYLLDFVISAHPGQSGEAQEEALKELSPYLESVGSDIRREAYIRRLAEVVQADPETMLSEYKRRGASHRTQIQRRDVKTKPVLQGDELYLMIAVAVRPDLFPYLRNSLDSSYFRDERALSMYRVLDRLSDGRIPGTSDIVGEIEDEDLKRTILEKAASPIYDDKAEETVTDLIRRISLTMLDVERQEVESALQSSSHEGQEIQTALLKRKLELDRMIKDYRQGKDG